MIDHFVYRNIVKMLLFAKDTVFIVFEMIHQLQALIFVDKVLDAFDHASPEIISRVFSLNWLLFLLYGLSLD